MKKTQRLKTFRGISVGMALILIAMGVSSQFPIYMDYWREYLSWTALALLGITCVTPLGSFCVAGEGHKKPLMNCLWHTFMVYGVMALFFISFFILLTGNVVTPTPAMLLAMFEVNMQDIGYNAIFYPWVLYVLALALLGGAGYYLRSPKMSSLLFAIFPARFITPFYASIIDYFGTLGFYIGVLSIIGVASLTLAQLLCYLIGYHLNFYISLATIGLGFALVYLPLSSVWKRIQNKLENPSLNPGLVLLALLIIFALYILLMYVIVHLFLDSFSHYFGSVEKNLPRIELHHQLTLLNIKDILWGLGMVTMTVIGAWLVNIYRGYSLRMAILLALVPIVFFWGVYEVTSLMITITPAMLEKTLEYIWSVPTVYLIGLIPVIILVKAFWRENAFIDGIYMVFPNESGKKLSRLRKLMILGAGFIGYAAMLYILTGLLLVKNLLFTFAVLFTFGLVLVLIGYSRFILTRKPL